MEWNGMQMLTICFIKIRNKQISSTLLVQIRMNCGIKYMLISALNAVKKITCFSSSLFFACVCNLDDVDTALEQMK